MPPSCATAGLDPGAIRSPEDFDKLPMLTKDNYHRRYPLPELCRDGRLDQCDTVAVSSGSSGTPTVWPRSVLDERAVAARFEQVFRDGFGADERRTLTVICFALGTWVGGMYTAACCRHLAAKGYPITVATPGNDVAEILRVVAELAPLFEQVVLAGYPPFVKNVIDAGLAQGIDWPARKIKLVLAGEVFSEEWRDLMGRRAGMNSPLADSASLYGTADAGVLGTETPLSVSIRRFLAARPDALRELTGKSRLPTLVQYDPMTRYFQAAGPTLLFSSDGATPLIRYHIADEGGLISFDDLLAFCGRHGHDPLAEVAGPAQERASARCTSAAIRLRLRPFAVHRVLFRRQHLPGERHRRAGTPRPQRLGHRQVRFAYGRDRRPGPRVARHRRASPGPGRRARPRQPARRRHPSGTAPPQ